MILADLGHANLGAYRSRGVLGKGLVDILDPGQFLHKSEGSSGGTVACPPGTATDMERTSANYGRCMPIGANTAASALTATARQRCAITVGAQTYPCSQVGVTSAMQAIQAGQRQLALRLRGPTPGGMNRMVDLTPFLGVGGAAVGVPGAPSAAGAAGVVAATQTAPGVFSCPVGYEVARDAAGNVVCAPPGTAASIAAAVARGPRLSARDRKGSRRTKRGRKGLRGLGDYLAMQQRAARYIGPIARFTTTQFARGVSTGGPTVPPWMASRLPPPAALFGGQPVRPSY